MNERIQELWRQAVLNNTKTPMNFQDAADEFAKLIIEECAGVVEKQKVFDTGYDRTQAIKHDALLVGYDDCATSIIHGLKEHFGVKE